MACRLPVKTESQIVEALNQVEGGRQVRGVCRELSVSEATYYAWKAKYGNIDDLPVVPCKENRRRVAPAAVCWWRRRESNPRPQALCLLLYMLSRVYCV